MIELCDAVAVRFRSANIDQSDTSVEWAVGSICAAVVPVVLEQLRPVVLEHLRPGLAHFTVAPQLLLTSAAPLTAQCLSSKIIMIF